LIHSLWCLRVRVHSLRVHHSGTTSLWLTIATTHLRLLSVSWLVVAHFPRWRLLHTVPRLAISTHLRSTKSLCLTVRVLNKLILLNISSCSCLLHRHPCHILSTRIDLVWIISRGWHWNSLIWCLVAHHVNLVFLWLLTVSFFFFLSIQLIFLLNCFFNYWI